MDSLRLPMTTTSMQSPSLSAEAESLTKHITQILRRAFRAVQFNRAEAADENWMPREGRRGRRENNGGTRRVEKTGSSIETGIAPMESRGM